MDGLPPMPRAASPAAEGGAAVSLPVSAGQAPLAIRANPMLGRYAATVCVIVHDEMFFLPAFLAHYRRLGLAIRYVPTYVRQTEGPRDYATLVRGKDDYHHFEYEPVPRIDLGAEEVAAHKRITEEANKILYRGTDKG